MPSHVVMVGGMAVGQQVNLGNLAYPLAKLPDNAAQQPMVVTRSNQGGWIPNFDRAHPTNPNLQEGGGGYLLSVCNMSSVSHTLGKVDVRLDSIAPYTAQLNEWNTCQQPYARPDGVGDGACGGGDPQNEYLHAPFTSTAPAGTVVTATQTTTGGDSNLSQKNYGPLPATLKPGEAMTIEVGMGSTAYGYQAFSAAGTYTFAFGLRVDGQAPVFAVSSPPTLLAAPAHEWSGEGCTRPAMQALIPPATNPPTPYICPEA
jgi:hypothetical protein